MPALTMRVADTATMATPDDDVFHFVNRYQITVDGCGVRGHMRIRWTVEALVAAQEREVAIVCWNQNTSLKTSHSVFIYKLLIMKCV